MSGTTKDTWGMRASPLFLAVAALLVVANPACLMTDGRPILAGDAGEEDDGFGPPDDAARPDRPDADVPAEAEAEAGADADSDGDVEVDGNPEDGDVGCTPVLSTPYRVLETASDGDERPVVLRSGSGFVFLGRPPGPVLNDGLRFQRFDVDGVGVTAPVWVLSSVEIGPQHSMIDLPDEQFATAFQLVSTDPEEAGIWVKIMRAGGAGGAAPTRIPDTDADSSDPSITFDGTDLVVVWSQHVTGHDVEVRAQFANVSTGEAIGSFVTLAVGREPTGQPQIAWSGTRHALIYFSAAAEALHVLQLDGTLTLVREDIVAPAAGDTVIPGYPALVWNGTEFGVAWESRITPASTIHLTTFAPGEVPVDHTPVTSVAISDRDPGQLGLAWNESAGEWGLVWSYARAGRVMISLVRIDGADFALLDGPVDLRPESISASHPSVAYNDGHYFVTWVEESTDGTTFPVYERTYGCAPDHRLPPTVLPVAVPAPAPH